ncbi:hypothetical protein N658DRAFT_501423 [Parathielavia hyrcaniae]|uniref:Uncharacterized protein n=1 Tax=Parathielavia hyrcaniae TaxID=113614 RepID=A0AAN6SXK7_9PEZI|nr:hypothetical protein N658DRAFT_501423 [Parathielavia hyrcaniae]
MPTILEVLQRENPDIIDHWGGVSYKNTTSTRFDEVTLDDGSRAHVQEWKDFTYGSIYAAYGDILDQPLGPLYKPVATPSTTPTEIVDENGVDTLGIVWSCNIERQPLKAAAAILRRRKGMATPPLAHAPDPTLASKAISWKYEDDSGSSMKPDWSVHDRTITKKYRYAYHEDPPKALVYAIGDSKLKQKWKSSWLSLGDSDCTVNTEKPYHAPGTSALPVQKTKTIDMERVHPLKQMATYCRCGETRYGYIVTQTELVAMRVRRIPGTSRPTAAIEYRSIPWSAHGHGKLTAHLAIWALGCIGMNDAHRNTEGPNGAVLPYMAKLTWWVEDKAKKTFTNVISQRVLSADSWGKLKPGVTLHTDDAGGKSLTSDFIAGVPLVPNLTQKMANLNLGKPTGTPPPTAPKKKTPAAPPTTTTPSSASKPKAYTKCKVGGKSHSLTQDKAGNYVVLESNKKTVKYKIVKDAAKKAWVVSGTSTVVQME